MTEPNSAHTEPSGPPETPEGRVGAPAPRKAQGRFADEFSSGVSSLIHQPVALTEPLCARKSYAEFLASIREPTCCGLFIAGQAADIAQGRVLFVRAFLLMRVDSFTLCSILVGRRFFLFDIGRG